jgi:multidrug efflux pump subunit AcrB
LAATLRYRPVVLVLWAIVALLTVPFYMFSQRELAPAEDQGFFFGVVQASANSTLEQARLFSDQIQKVYASMPETAGTFQITLPGGGFGGMVTKPWSQRSKTTQQLLMESMGPLSKIAGVRVIPMAPPPLPGGGDFGGSSRVRRGAQTIEDCGQLGRRPSRAACLRRRRSEVRQLQAEVVRPRRGRAGVQLCRTRSPTMSAAIM